MDYLCIFKSVSKLTKYRLNLFRIHEELLHIQPSLFKESITESGWNDHEPLKPACDGNYQRNT